MNAYPVDPVRLKGLNSIPAMDPGNRTHLRLVDPEDAAYLADLRSDPELARHLTKGAFTAESQRSWIVDYKDREAAGQEYYFIIVSDGERKGAVRLYDFRCISGSISFCFGSWIVTRPRPEGLTTCAFLLATEVGFDHLGFPMCHFDVRRDNVTATAFYERAGAMRTGEDSLNFYYVFPAERFEAFRRRSVDRVRGHRVPRLS